jgi:hypothetical protein
MMAGPVNPSAFYLVMEFVLLLALAEGTIGASPSSPTHRTHILAAVLAAGAGALVPYVRTLEPAKVIADPALMLLFLAVLESATLSLRCLLARSSARAQKPVSRWTQRIVSWTRAMHETRQQPNRAAGPGTKVPQLITAVGWRRRS